VFVRNCRISVSEEVHIQFIEFPVHAFIHTIGVCPKRIIQSYEPGERNLSGADRDETYSLLKKESANRAHIKTSAMSETLQDTGTGESTTSSLSSPKDTTSLTQSVEKLEGSMATGQSNYNAWNFRIIQIVKEKDLLEAIESSTVSAAKGDQAFTIITLNIKDSQIPHIQDASTAMEAWTSLKEVHQGIGTYGRMVLMQRLWALKMSEGQDMAQHLN